MATIKEIAKLCNVSIATVSNILNGKGNAGEDTRKLVLTTAKRIGYVPNYMARSLKQKETKVIGVITEDLTVFNCTAIVDGIHEYLEEQGYTFLLGNLRLYKRYDNKFYTSDAYHVHVKEEMKVMQAKQVDGMIYIGAHSRYINCIPEDMAVPVVIAYGISDNDKNPSVVFDDRQGAYDAATALISKHRDKIGVIAGEDKSIHTRERLAGFQRALYDHEILFNPDYLYFGNWQESSGYEGAKRLIDGGVTGIFAMNDIMAGGVYRYADENSLVIGKDFSLIGFDNREICAAYHPSLSTMALPLAEIGRKAAQIIIEMLEKKYHGNGECYKIPCELLVRESL